MASLESPQALKRKVGPLPVWAWAAVILIGYFLYSKLHSSPSNTGANANGTAQTDNGSGTYVPGFDAAGGTPGGSMYGTPGNVYNYYYGDSNANNANGGGTSNGRGSGQTPPTPGSPSGEHNRSGTNLGGGTHGG